MKNTYLTMVTASMRSKNSTRCSVVRITGINMYSRKVYSIVCLIWTSAWYTKAAGIIDVNVAKGGSMNYVYQLCF